ncbi:MAG: DUF4910 domain-containing protein [Candidatus Lokiarchaeota archaeon]|nr:DUF4910 domain-containing protein [Candidatus Lokiarchaeota archaeon]
MLPKEVVRNVRETVSGFSAKDFVAGISQFHRIQASPGFHDAVEYLTKQINRISDAKIEVYEYPANGKGRIGTWETPYGWSAESATLELVEPEKKMLADFQAEPISLVAHSTSVDDTFEVVFVGEGLEDSDYEGEDIEGKLVLTTNKASRVHRIACIERNAAGVLTFVPPEGKNEIASMRRYEAAWPAPGEGAKTKFGFALTQADGLKIKNMLKEGKKVQVKAHVEAQIEDRNLEVVSALLEGEEPNQEVWLISHLCHPHPGANDNASGSGALLEVLRTIERLIETGDIKQPSYSIRFLWVPEWHGTIKFIDDKKKLLKKVKAVINVDMVGSNPCKSGSITNLFRTPYSLPTTLNNVTRYWFEQEAGVDRKPEQGGTKAPFKVNYSTYSAGSDHFMFTDSNVSTPAVMINQYPDKFYHTSTDTVDKIDPAQMAFLSRALVLSAISLAHPKYVSKETLLTLCRNECIEIMQRITNRGVNELARCLGDPEDIYPRILRWLDYAKALGVDTLEKATEEWKLISEQEAVRNALKASLEMTYTTEMMVARKAYEGACVEIGLEAKDEEHLDIDLEQFDEEIRRKTEHALYPGHIARNLEEKRAKYYRIREEDKQFYNKIDELLNLSHEWASLNEVYDRLSFEFGDWESKELWSLIKDLEKLGLIEIRDAE